MPTTMQASRIQPKRKRAQVTYYESDSNESDAEASDACSVEDSHSAKKYKAGNGKVVSTKPLPKHKIFPFMKLPAELKNQIYGLALRDENGIFLISKTIAYRHTVQRSRPYGYDESNGRRRHSRHSYLLEQQTDTDPEAPPPASLHPNILRVSREMYAETQPILYGNNAFTFEDTTALHGFLAKIGRINAYSFHDFRPSSQKVLTATTGSRNCATLTKIAIKAWGYTKAHKAMNFPAFTMLGSAVNLESVYINCRIHWDGPRAVARKIYRDAHHYFEAVGDAKGRYDAAVDILEFHPENWAGQSGSRFETITSTKGFTTEECVEEFRAELRKRLRSH